MLTVIETPEFMAWSALVWSDAEREAFIDWIADHPEAGDVIPGSAACARCAGAVPVLASAAAPG